MSGGEKTRASIAAQPEWLAQVPTDRRLPAGRWLFTGCGTSFHAAQTAGEAVQALELVLSPRRASGAGRSERGGGLGPASRCEEFDGLVCVSHEGTTRMTLEAARVWDGPVWLVTGAAESPLAEVADEVIVCAPEIEQSWCHTASYTAAVAALCALRGEDVSWLSDAVRDALAGPRLPVSEHERWLVAGAGRDWPTAQEAVLKLREGVHVAAEAWETEQLLHGHLAAVDETVRAFVLAGEGRAAERGREAAAALEALGAPVTIVPTRHAVVDIVPFQLLTVDLAADRGIDPDPIRRDDPRWARAREAYA